MLLKCDQNSVQRNIILVFIVNIYMYILRLLYFYVDNQQLGNIYVKVFTATSIMNKVLRESTRE